MDASRVQQAKPGRQRLRRSRGSGSDRARCGILAKWIESAWSSAARLRLIARRARSSTRPIGRSSSTRTASAARSPRNIPDELIKACAGHGGVVGINGVGPLGSGPPTAEVIVRRIDYVAQLVGAEHTASASTTCSRVQSSTSRTRRAGDLAQGVGLWPRHPICAARSDPGDHGGPRATRLSGCKHPRIWRTCFGRRRSLEVT